MSEISARLIYSLLLSVLGVVRRIRCRTHADAESRRRFTSGFSATPSRWLTVDSGDIEDDRSSWQD